MLIKEHERMDQSKNETFNITPLYFETMYVTQDHVIVEGCHRLVSLLVLKKMGKPIPEQIPVKVLPVNADVHIIPLLQELGEGYSYLFPMLLG